MRLKLRYKDNFHRDTLGDVALYISISGILLTFYFHTGFYEYFVALAMGSMMKTWRAYAFFAGAFMIAVVFDPVMAYFGHHTPANLWGSFSLNFTIFFMLNLGVVIGKVIRKLFKLQEVSKDACSGS